MDFLIVSIVGYLFGCLQWSYILSKILKKEDIRSLGGGNAGASNTLSVYGMKMGVVVGLLDIIKAIISILIIKHLFKSSILENNMFYLYLNGLFVILGHNYPFFMNFKGGKGTASLVGTLLGIDLRLGLLAILITFIVTMATDYIVLGTMSLVLYTIIATIYLDFNIGCIFISIVIALLSVYNHIPNFKKILSKSETSVRATLKGKAKSI